MRTGVATVPRPIVFDCDGVLIDSERLACGTVADSLHRLGLDTSLDDILLRYTGVSAPAMYADIQARPFPGCETR